jgi:hypothetical protein
VSKHLYEVTIIRGRSNSRHSIFYKNVDNLGAKPPDFGGINNICLISHHLDADTIHMLCSEGIRKKSDITVEEITKESLNDPLGHHRLYTDVVENYFLPYNTYPNIR